MFQPQSSQELTKNLVRGEASESDEETEALDVTKKIAVFASEVSGEATESDEDVYEKRSSTEERPNIGSDWLSLLQRKLIENNVNIWKDLNVFIKSFVTPASKQLLNTDQLLIKSQVSMQSVISSLKLAQGNIKQLHEKTSDVFTTNFIPNINIQITQ